MEGQPEPAEGAEGPTLLVVIVNYRIADLVIDGLRSIEAEIAGYPGRRVVVTDNASGDGSVDRIAGAIADEGWGGWVELMPLANNGGFSSGNNAAIRPALAAPDPPRYVLLLNPDTVARPGAIGALLAFLEARPDVGLVGSRLEDPDGTPQNSAFPFPSILGELDGGLRLGVVTKLLRARVGEPSAPAEARRVDWVAGASLMVRREVFDAVGTLDDGYFMYYEEVDFCLRAARAGWPCWYVPASRVVHLVGRASGVTDRGATRKRRPRYWFEARRRYFRSNHGAALATLADIGWAAGFATFRARQAIQRKADVDPDRYLRDFIRYNFLPEGGAPMAQVAEQIARPEDGPPPLNRGDRDGNPRGRGLLALLREDLQAHDGNPLEQGFWAVAVHRFGNWRMGRPKVIRAPLTLLYRLLNKWVEWTCGISLPYTVRLGRRVRIWHHGGMILHARSIGDDVQIRQNTTFGLADPRRPWEIPTIGDRVDIGCGACIIGGVSVGPGAKIGANAVVLADVPEGATAVGVPARIVRRGGGGADL